VASCDMQSQSIRILVNIRTTARRFPRCRLNAHSRFEKLSVRETKGRQLRATGVSMTDFIDLSIDPADYPAPGRMHADLAGTELETELVHI
jgi:hypothetical protein